MEKNRISYIKNTLLFDILSKGQFGLIRLGINFDTKRLVMIKEISLELLNNNIDLYNKLKEEGKLVKSIPRHPNIVDFIDITESNVQKRVTKIEQEFLNGGNLNQFLKNYRKNSTLPLDQSIIQHFIYSICQGLFHLHKHQIMHRDIKLENIMLTFDQIDLTKEFDKLQIMNNLTLSEILKNDKDAVFKFISDNLEMWKDYSYIYMKNINNPDEFIKTVLKSKVKIIDFGFSRTLEDGDYCSTFIGNYNSMSKEIIKRNYDYKSEIWAIGIITYHLLTGSPPFYSTNANDLSEKLNNGSYSFSKEYKPSLEIVDFIQMLLQDTPSNRPDFPKIFKHPFLVNNPKNFKNCDIENTLILSIYETKQFFFNEPPSFKMEQLISSILPHCRKASFQWNENEFIDENYFDNLYQLHLYEVEKYEEHVIVENNYFN